MKKIIFTAIITLCISGCSDPKAANEANFQAAIQAYLDSVYPKCYFVHTFPTEIELYTKYLNRGKGVNQLNALTKVGILSKKEISREMRTRPYSFSDKKTEEVIKYSYDLTKEGKKYYTKDAAKRGGFCLGKAYVNSILQFTEPTARLGYTVSKVNYTYSVTELPEWTMSDEVKAINGDLRIDSKSESTPIKKTAFLILTNNGWIHERLFQE